MAAKQEIKAGQYMYEAACDVLVDSKADKWYTPNGLRRVVFSSAGILGVRYPAVLKTKRFEFEKMRACVSSEDYKPMSWVLGARGVDKVCSHLEEIVYCTAAVNGVGLHNSETDAGYALLGKRGLSGAELQKALKTRYVRLKQIVYFNGTVDEVRVLLPDLAKSDYFMGDDEKLKGCVNVISVQGDEWYKGHYFRPQYYEADKEGGKLWTYIMRTKQELNTKKVTEYKEKRGIEAEDKIFTGETVLDLKRLSEVLAVILALCRMTKDKDICSDVLPNDSIEVLAKGLTGAFNSLNGKPVYVGGGINEINCPGFFQNLKSLGAVPVSPPKESTEFDYVKDTVKKACNRQVRETYLILLDVLSSFGSSVHTKMPVYWRSALSGVKVKLLMLKEKEAVLRELGYIDGGSFTDSLAAIGSTIVSVALDNNSDLAKYKTETYWCELINRGGVSI